MIYTKYCCELLIAFLLHFKQVRMYSDFHLAILGIRTLVVCRAFYSTMTEVVWYFCEEHTNQKQRAVPKLKCPIENYTNSGNRPSHRENFSVVSVIFQIHWKIQLKLKGKYRSLIGTQWCSLFRVILIDKLTIIYMAFLQFWAPYAAFL